MDTKTKIITVARNDFAATSYESFNMRSLAKHVGIVPSVLYHYFATKDELLRAMFDSTNTQLGVLRSNRVVPQSTAAMLRDRIEFQFDHAAEIIAVLKYYLTFRKRFKKNKTGFVPEKTSLHIEEVLEHGIVQKELDPSLEVAEEAKVITHAINGFILEYFPDIPKGKEKKDLIRRIHQFIWRGLPKYEAVR